MKKLIIGLIIFAVAAVGTILVVAQNRGGGMRGHGRGFAKMAQKLNLSDEQKAQFKQITDASREKIKPLRESQRATRQKLNDLTKEGQFDEAQVTALANEQAQIHAQIIVERERAKSQIFQVLTAEQREQAKQMKEQMKNRFKGKGRKHQGEGSQE